MNDEIQQEMNEIREELADMRQDYNLNAIGSLMDNLTTLLTKFGEKKFYDEGSTKILTSAIANAVAKLGEIKIDMSPIMKIASDISAQNKVILDTVANAPKQSSADGSEYMAIMVSLIKQNNEFLQKIIQQPKETKQQEDIRPKEWNFKVNYDHTGKIKDVTAKAN